MRASCTRFCIRLMVWAQVDRILQWTVSWRRCDILFLYSPYKSLDTIASLLLNSKSLIPHLSKSVPNSCLSPEADRRPNSKMPSLYAQPRSGWTATPSHIEASSSTVFWNWQLPAYHGSPGSTSDYSPRFDGMVPLPSPHPDHLPPAPQPSCIDLPDVGDERPFTNVHEDITYESASGSRPVSPHSGHPYESLQ